eukprot:TRINITY_DN4958_c0_g1_i1.p1 TRINITY_DN4958_c0_g1~~TRINITY_DN4958_c0_g1_i1.p1  ORF type:complete len:406 (+),score=132.45 TRINITY_DN4958_c0_g1_i1:64-1281(+)
MSFRPPPLRNRARAPPKPATVAALKPVTQLLGTATPEMQITGEACRTYNIAAEFDCIEKCLGGAVEWSVQHSALQRLDALMRGGAGKSAGFAEMFATKLSPGVVGAITNLRSHLVVKGCETAKLCCATTPRAEWAKIAPPLIKALQNQFQSSKSRAMAAPAFDAAKYFMQHSVVDGEGLEALLTGCRHKNAGCRAKTYELLFHYLRLAEHTPELERAMGRLPAILKAGWTDADASVRAIAKVASCPLGDALNLGDAARQKSFAEMREVYAALPASTFPERRDIYSAEAQTQTPAQVQEGCPTVPPFAAQLVGTFSSLALLMSAGPRRTGLDLIADTVWSYHPPLQADREMPTVPRQQQKKPAAGGLKRKRDGVVVTPALASEGVGEDAPPTARQRTSYRGETDAA